MFDWNDEVMLFKRNHYLVSVDWVVALINDSVYLPLV